MCILTEPRQLWNTKCGCCASSDYHVHLQASNKIMSPTPTRKPRRHAHSRLSLKSADASEAVTVKVIRMGSELLALQDCCLLSGSRLILK